MWVDFLFLALICTTLCVFVFCTFYGKILTFSTRTDTWIFVQVRFLDAILSQNNTDDHMQEFIKQGGLDPMIKLLAITPLAAESTYASANSAIIDTCRNILDSPLTPKYQLEMLIR